MTSVHELPSNAVVEPHELASSAGCGCKGCGESERHRSDRSRSATGRVRPSVEALPMVLLRTLESARQAAVDERAAPAPDTEPGAGEVLLDATIPVSVVADYLSPFLEPTEEIYVVEEAFEVGAAAGPTIHALIGGSGAELDDTLVGESQIVAVETGLEIVGSSAPHQGFEDLRVDDGPVPPDPPAPPWRPPGYAPTCEIHVPEPNHDGPRRRPGEPVPPRPPGTRAPGAVAPDPGRPWWEAASGTTSSLAPSGAVGPVQASILDLKPPPPPYCPEGYSFDFDWQSCWPDGVPHRSPPPADVNAHACRCPPGHSWLADTDRCWERTAVDRQRPRGAWGFDVGPITPPKLVRFGQANFNDWQYRRKVRGSGRCRGSTNDTVRTAYQQAYARCRAAQLELDYIASRPTLFQRRHLWGAAVDDDLNATWEYWFGDGNATFFELDTRISFLRDYIERWSRAFRTGFYKTNDHPVYIRCKSRECVGDGTKARHLVRNTVELCDGTYFGMNEEQRAITMLHEMGHFSTSRLMPRDERNGTFCDGGWNAAENMCYRPGLTEFTGTKPSRFEGGNPKALADASTGSSDAFYTMVNNVDNYVCLMWNRWQDRQDQRFDL